MPGLSSTTNARMTPALRHELHESDESHEPTKVNS